MGQEVEKEIGSLNTFVTWAEAKFSENDLKKIKGVIMPIARGKEKDAGGPDAVRYEAVYRDYSKDDPKRGVEFYSITMLNKATGNRIWSYS
jgi:hypothetical protein